jgi:UDP-2,4-diacetamido-2,4,6-trideoxy-beta-L-altropyranose hydrolase
MTLDLATRLVSPVHGTTVFRADASIQIGTGHVMRCLTLADELKRHGHQTVFVCRPFEGDMCEEITRRGHALLRLSPVDDVMPQPEGPVHAHWLGVGWREDASETISTLAAIGATPDWLVVDHYALDCHWETALRPFVGRIMVLDDLADRRHDADLLLDQNLYNHMELRYAHLVSDRCEQILGPRFALLRDEFRQARKAMKERTGRVSRVLVFFGGIDQVNMTGRTLAALTEVRDQNMPSGIDVVVGTSHLHRDDVERRCAGMKNVTLHTQTSRMADLMVAADISIGAGGTTTWERAYVGLPSLVTAVAENQREMTDAAARAGICWNLGWYEEVTSELIAARFREACATPQLLRKMSRQSLAVSAGDHETGTSTVAEYLLKAVSVYA